MTSPCRLPATAYSIYSQLPSILGAIPPSKTWGHAMQWWQGPTYHGISCYMIMKLKLPPYMVHIITFTILTTKIFRLKFVCNTLQGVMYKDMIAIPCVVNGSHILTFSYMTSYTCISQLLYLPYHFKVTNSLKQDVWVSSYTTHRPFPTPHS